MKKIGGPVPSAVSYSVFINRNALPADAGGVSDVPRDQHKNRQDNPADPLPGRLIFTFLYNFQSVSDDRFSDLNMRSFRYG